MRRGWISRLSAWPVYRWVLVLGVAYFAVALTGTWINFLELHFNAIGTYDLSVNMQSLSSTIHGGKPFPFYEATNCGRNDRCSYLLVHPVLLAYPVAGVYAISPSSLTLFALQDAALALAAWPLFAIARERMRSERWALIAAGVYLAWLPAFSGIFSFHWEAFIPLETFTFFYLWLTGRYVWAIPVMVVAFVTLEITPVITFFIGIFFLVPFILPAAELVRTQLVGSRRSYGSVRVGLRRVYRRVGSAVARDRQIRASLGLLLASVLAYVLLHELVRQGGGLLGLPPLPAKYSLSLAQPVYAANFTFANFISNWPQKVVFWLVMFGTLALIPFLAPRTLVISVPWIAFSSLATASLYRMGNQYAFISAAVLFIGFAYGLAELERWVHRGEARAIGTRAEIATSRTGSTSVPVAPRPAGRPSGASVTGAPPAPDDPPEIPTPAAPVRARNRRLSARRRSTIVATVVTGIIVFNLFLNPLNPLAAPLKTQRPFAEQASLGLGPSINTTGYQQLERLIGAIGPDAIVGVSPELFPLLANDRYAYPLLAGFNASYLPYDANTSTQFVLLSEHGGHIPLFLGSSSTGIYNTTYWGVRGWVTTTYLGPIILFQRNYTGPLETFGPPLAPLSGVFAPTAGLEPSHAGRVESQRGTTSGYVISTIYGKQRPRPGNVTPGQVFHTTPVNLGPGSYHVTVSLMGNDTGYTKRPHENSTAVTILAHATIDTILAVKLNVTWFSPINWTVLSFNVTIPSPVFNFEITGTNNQRWMFFRVEYVTVTPVSDP